jgi:hypothetical protein
MCGEGHSFLPEIACNHEYAAPDSHSLLNQCATETSSKMGGCFNLLAVLLVPMRARPTVLSGGLLARFREVLGLLK